MKIKAFLLFLLLAPFLLIAVFNHPSLDDYWNANTILAHGRLGAIAYSFNHFSGRYFSTTLMCLLNTLPEQRIWVFKLFPVLICSGLAGALYYFLKKACYGASPWEIFSITLLLTLLHIVNMRVLFEGLYWMSSTVTYQVGFILLLTWLGLILSYTQRKSAWKLFGMLALTACFTGSFESIEPLFLTALLFLYFKFKKRKRNQDLQILFYCLAVNLVCLAATGFSQGVHSRIATDLNRFHSSLPHACLRAFESVCYYYGKWLFSPWNMLGMVILLPFVKQFALYRNLPFSGRNETRLIILIVAISLFAGLLLYFPQLYLESDLPFPRVTTLLFALFCFTAAAILTVIIRLLNPVLSILRPGLVRNLLWPAFIGSVLISHNFRKVASDLLSGTACRFNQEQNKRYSDLRNCQADTCYISPIINWPASIEQTPGEETTANSMLYQDIYFNKKIIIKRR